MQFISWSVNGIRAAWNRGLSTFLQKYDADIYAFQETKVNEPYLLAELDGHGAYWSFCDKKTMLMGRRKTPETREEMQAEIVYTENKIRQLHNQETVLIAASSKSHNFSKKRRGREIFSEK